MSIPISIVIRTYGLELVPKILKTIDEQVAANYSINEIVVVNGCANYRFSTEIYEGRNKLRFVTNPHVPYRPGQALNIGIQHTSGEIIVFLSGHSLPINAEWLGSLVLSMSHKSVAGVCGAQRPIPRSNFLERCYRGVWYGSSFLGSVFQHFNLANAALSRYFWELQPFNESLEGCEDRHWARMIRAHYGATFTFNPKAVVFHSHIDSFPGSLRYMAWLLRTYVTSRRLGTNPDIH